MTTIKIYYGSQTVDVDKLSGYSTFTKMHPELQRRLTSMFHAAKGSVGLGIGWRDPVGNDAEVRRREGLRARGVRTAPMLYSNKTWHCAGGAADLTGDFAWVERNADKFGLWVFLPPEPWHVQPKEIPHSRPVGSDPSAWLGGAAPTLPTSIAPPSPTTYDPNLGAFDPANGKYNIWPKKTDKPRIHSGSVGDAVKYAQGTVKSLGINPGPIDGVFGRKTNKAVRAAQRWNNLKPDGWVGPATWKIIDIYALK